MGNAGLEFQTEMNISLKRDSIPEALLGMPKSIKGGYVLEFRIPRSETIKVGKLGEIWFESGWYYYVGSAMGGLRGRLLRHTRGPGKPHWHIDHVTIRHAPVRAWYVVSDAFVEDEIVQIIRSEAKPAVKGFGCSDSPGAETHLFISGSRRNFLSQLSNLWESGQINIGKAPQKSGYDKIRRS